ncbi:MAG: transglycosylase domain-containing protein [Eubacterium sp.]|nr:transglycosylase domain-containing protein [Eubacterium sp.]
MSDEIKENLNDIVETVTDEIADQQIIPEDITEVLPEATVDQAEEYVDEVLSEAADDIAEKVPAEEIPVLDATVEDVDGVVSEPEEAPIEATNEPASEPAEEPVDVPAEEPVEATVEEPGEELPEDSEPIEESLPKIVETYPAEDSFEEPTIDTDILTDIEPDTDTAGSELPVEIEPVGNTGEEFTPEITDEPIPEITEEPIPDTPEEVVPETLEEAVPEVPAEPKEKAVIAPLPVEIEPEPISPEPEPVAKAPTMETVLAAMVAEREAAKAAEEARLAEEAAKAAAEAKAAEEAAKAAEEARAAEEAAKAAEESKAAEEAAKSTEETNAKEAAADAAGAQVVAARSDKTKKKQKVKKGHPILKMVFLLFFVTIIAAGGAVLTYGYLAIRDYKDIDVSDIYSHLSQSSQIYDKDGNKLETIYSGENRTIIKYSDMPDNLVNAFIALEDKTFWDHNGFNFIRMAGAIKEKLTSGGEVSGTSTITQQLARNIFLSETRFDHSINRKIQEAWITMKLEEQHTKREIIEAYLNTIDLGFNSAGVEAAAQAYFSKSVGELSLDQCAMLAALPAAPVAYAPVVLSDGSDVTEDTVVLKKNASGTFLLNETGIDRRDLCLELMAEQGYITQEECDNAKAVKLADVVAPKYSLYSVTSNYFNDFLIQTVIDDLQAQYNCTYEAAWDKVYHGGLHIYTTIDKKAQKIIEKEFQDSSNFPTPVDIRYDEDGNILDKKGNIILFDMEDFFNKKGQYVMKKNEAKLAKDGSVVIKANKRLHIYETVVNGETDYSIEFPYMYHWKDDKIYSVAGGYINIPMGTKTMNAEGDIVISADFVNSDQGQAFFKFKKNGRVVLTKNSYTLNQESVQPQAAMTIIDNKTGEVKAMVGGRTTNGRMMYNRAVATRQPGSSIKPLAIYSAALQQSAEECAEGKKHKFVKTGYDKQGARFWGDWITAGSYVVDERMKVNGKTWPENSGGGYSGRNTVRSAIRNSINTCAVKIYYQIGNEYSFNMVKKYGITTLVEEGAISDNNPAALALGGLTNGVNTLEMAAAYTVFPNYGKKREKWVIYSKVEDSDGKTILSTEELGMKRVLRSDVAWIMADMMKGVVSGGTGYAAAIDDVQVGGKTGTTSDEYDIWFDGFTPRYSASIWIGNDVNITLSGMSGYAAALWGKIMNQIPNAKKGSYKDMPADVEYHGGEYYAKGTYSYIEFPKKKKYTICKETGLLANEFCPKTKDIEYDPYFDTDEKKPPKDVCNVHKEPEKEKEDEAKDGKDGKNKDGKTDANTTKTDSKTNDKKKDNNKNNNKKKDNNKKKKKKG